MSGYSWINQMDFTHPGMAAIGGYQNASKQRGEKKAREMAYLKDQAALDKLILEIAHLPEQQAADLEFAQNKILTEQLTAMLKQQEYTMSPEMHQAKLGSEYALQNQRNAAANKSNRAEQPGAHNFGTSTGISRQLADAIALERMGFTEEAKIIRDSVNREMSGSEISGSDLSQIPVALREELIAKGNYYTGDTSSTVKYLKMGMDLGDIAEMHGKKREDVKNIVPQYATATPVKGLIQKGQMYSAEAQVLDPIATKYLGEYYDRFMVNDYSINQVKDALLGLNDEKQARFIAGTMIYPEVAALQARALGITPGVEIQKHLEDRMKGNLQASTFGVTEPVWNRSRQLFTEAMALSGQIAAIRGLNPNVELQENINKNTEAYKIYEKHKSPEIEPTKEEKKELPNIGIGTNTPVKDVLGIMRNIP